MLAFIPIRSLAFKTRFEFLFVFFNEINSFFCYSIENQNPYSLQKLLTEGRRSVFTGNDYDYDYGYVPSFGRRLF